MKYTTHAGSQSKALDLISACLTLGLTPILVEVTADRAGRPTKWSIAAGTAADEAIEADTRVEPGIVRPNEVPGLQLDQPNALVVFGPGPQFNIAGGLQIDAVRTLAWAVDKVFEDLQRGDSEVEPLKAAREVLGACLARWDAPRPYLPPAP